MADSAEIYREVTRWLWQFVDEAVPAARLMVTTMRAKDDAIGADHWLRIIGAIEELQRRG